MLRPSLEEVKALAKQYNTIPVFYEFSADNQTPLNIYRAFSQESRNSFILESVSNGVQWDRYSFVGFSPKEEIRITGNTAEIRSGEKSETFEVAHPIAFLKERMAAYHSPVLEGAPNFTGGLIGYFGYDTVRYMEKKLTNVPEDDIHMPDCHLFLYEELLAYDHLNSNGIVILNLHTDGDLGAQYAAAQWRAEELADIVRHYNPQPQERRHHGESVVRSNLTKEQYSQMVRDAKEYIKNGDIFQIVLSQRFEISNPPDSFSVYRKLRATNPSPYLYYFHTPDYDVAGASPEMLAKVTNGVIHNRPIAGTKPRGRTPEEDIANEKALAADPKERAEHTMLVDLGRNDVGKVSEFGSVEVTRYMVTERASKVMHLGFRRDRKAAPGSDCTGCTDGDSAGRHAVRRTESACHGADRPVRKPQAWALRRNGRLSGIRRQHQHLHCDPHRAVHQR